MHVADEARARVPRLNLADQGLQDENGTWSTPLDRQVAVCNNVLLPCGRSEMWCVQLSSPVVAHPTGIVVLCAAVTVCDAACHAELVHQTHATQSPTSVPRRTELEQTS